MRLFSVLGLIAVLFVLAYEAGVFDALELARESYAVESWYRDAIWSAGG
jgi:hypothetical protein